MIFSSKPGKPEIQRSRGHVNHVARSAQPNQSQAPRLQRVRKERASGKIQNRGPARVDQAMPSEFLGLAQPERHRDGGRGRCDNAAHLAYPPCEVAGL